MNRMEKVGKYVLVFALFGVLAGCTSSPLRRSSGEYFDDKVIAAKVKTDLYADPLTKGHQIDVNVYKGVVQLSGFVDTRESVQRAAQLAKNVKGVVAVHDDIKLRSQVPAERPMTSPAEKSGQGQTQTP